MTEFYDLQKKRRSIYALGKNVNQSQDELVKTVEGAVQQAPTAFHSQTVRAVTLFDGSHDKLWDIVADRLKSEVPTEEAYQKTLQKINGFKSAYGTVMLFTDTDVVKGLEENFPLYADNFYDWSEQGLGMALYSIWTTFAEMGIGANIQHYNPIIDDLVRKEFNIPENWRLRGQLDFGSIEAPAGDKEFMSTDEQFKVFK
ncbi:nitroreductase family protein [Secundilactobacillus oryzae JCM 18671]|uniref:Nitroreductase family protein n=1 Tax=Secundilactobacillus oryzae JCM 18671 TaxID=1291743 RepID=A0A081BIK3_9LACO|nr:nitroreductase family protein [Secundilactobacillus oryzae]GAK47871.1 nitroreductase family protein [Secundilactobacillus oryzae JCM 18671]